MINLSCERYKKEIVDRLAVYDREGRGQLLQLATVKVGETEVPFVAFSTGGDVVVTARHHVGEFWGPTETVMKLAMSGQRGLTLVPVVDIGYYDRAERLKAGILNEKGPCAAIYMHELFGGYRGEGPPRNAWNNWADYRYTQDNSPAYIDAIKKLIDQSLLFVDLHNGSLQHPHLITYPNGDREGMGVLTMAAEQMERGRLKLASCPSPKLGEELIPGVHRGVKGSFCGTASEFASGLGKDNLVFELPVFQPYSSFTPYSRLRDINQIAEATAGTISALARYIN